MRREGTVTVLRAGRRNDGILTLRRLVVARRRDGRAGPPLLRSFERPLCSRLGFEQLAPYVEERPADEHGSAEQDESGNDGHRDGYAGKPRDEAQALACNIIRVHGDLRTLSWSEDHLPTKANRRVMRVHCAPESWRPPRRTLRS